MHVATAMEGLIGWGYNCVNDAQKGLKIDEGFANGEFLPENMDSPQPWVGIVHVGNLSVR